MASYGGYTKTGYGDDSGGFVLGGTQPQNSQAQRSHAEDSLRPITVKQASESEELGNDFQIDNAPVTQVSLVGQIRSANLQTTNVQYKLDDGTAMIEVRKYIDAEKQDAAAASMVETDQFVRVYGRIKAFSNKRYIAATAIRPVTDLNEVHYHLLDATASHLYYTRGGAPGAGGANQAQNQHEDGMFIDPNNGGANLTVNSGNQSSKLAGCSPMARKMWTFLVNTPGGNEGVHLQQVTGGTGMTARDVLAAADELLSQGVIFTTMDDETWAILEY